MKNIAEDEKYIKRCIELGKMATGNTYPNPLVGSVIVHQGKIIGEGYHRIYGETHAEVNAIESVKDKSLLPLSTLYVNLEPCAHYGNTPPCAERIVKEKIPRVVIGTKDSSNRVSGKGIDILNQGGCEVKIGVLEEQCRALNKRFFTYHEKQRPYIILKWAQTQDGYIDKLRKPDDPIQPNWITNQVSKRLVHKWRVEEQAILIGSKTAIKDNPSLNVREWSGKNPKRYLIDKDFELNDSYKLIHDELETVIFVDEGSEQRRLKKYANDTLSFVKLDFSKDLLNQIVDYFYKEKILSVIIEGGAITLNQFLKEGLWDEARIFIGDKFFYDGIEAPDFPRQTLSYTQEYKNTKLYLLHNDSAK
jgi:diaminohydroxyphosphoribosylaminopyrimidine deaminase/5-amino-6-(5-phosphoribosylamino)uracil reductase